MGDRPKLPKPKLPPFVPRTFSPREKLAFFRLRDRTLAGDSSKDRRFGPEIMAEKKWLQAHQVLLGDCVQLEKAHDKYREGLVRMALRKIFGG